MCIGSWLGFLFSVCSCFCGILPLGWCLLVLACCAERPLDPLSGELLWWRLWLGSRSSVIPLIRMVASQIK
jgi:hypothetical protein